MAKANRILTVGRVRRRRPGGGNAFPGPSSQSELNKVVADTYAEMVMQWHTEFREKHFGEGAYVEYGYARRSKRYQDSKFKKYGHRNPLQFSGESRRLSGFYKLKKSRNGARVSMPVRAFNFKPKGFAGNMREEFTRTSKRELAAYGVTARRYLRQRLKGEWKIVKVNL